MKIADWVEQMPPAAVTIVSVVLFLAVLYLAIAWLVLPVYVIRRLDQMRKLLTEIRDNAEAAEAKRMIDVYRERAER